jgi:hypothetical protein
VKTGTLFASSNVPLHKWLQAMYLCGCGTIPLKPQELSCILNVTFKTAAFMLKRIRDVAAQTGLKESGVSYQSPLDETYLFASRSADISRLAMQISSAIGGAED